MRKTVCARVLVVVALLAGACSGPVVACPEGEECRWIGSLEFIHDNPGFADFQVYATQMSELELFQLWPFLGTGTEPFWAQERWEQVVRALPADTCSVLPIVPPPQTRCLDGGALTVQADWPGFDFPIVPFVPETGNYPVQIAWGEALGARTPGAPITLTASGGGQVSAFTASAASPPPLELLSPAHDPNEPLPAISRAEPLNVRWSGASTFQDVVIVLGGEWVDPPELLPLIGCHVVNDGEFSVPASILGEIELGNVARLGLWASEKVPVTIPELPGSFVRVASHVSLIVHYAPEARP